MDNNELPQYGAPYSSAVYEPVPEKLWELDVKPLIDFEERWRTGAPKELKPLTEMTVLGHYDRTPDSDEVTITRPDGTTAETTWGALTGAVSSFTVDGMQEGETPTREVTITSVCEPEADAPTVVEG